MTSPAVGVGEAERVKFALKVVADRADLAGLRVLDLACCHGAFSGAFAAAGADVLGIDGRQVNLNHAGGGARYELCDVRDLSPDRHGEHDVTLCLGILYHLEAPDALRLLGTMRQMTTRFAVIDTHTGADKVSVTVDGRQYRGAWFGEAITARRSAIRNQTSWWFTPDSLEDAIRTAGWGSIKRVKTRRWPGWTADRQWLVVR
jgi:hypothetical protein